MQPQAPMYVYEPRNRRSVTYLARLLNRIHGSPEVAYYVGAGLGLALGFVIGAFYF